MTMEKLNYVDGLDSHLRGNDEYHFHDFVLGPRFHRNDGILGNGERLKSFPIFTHPTTSSKSSESFTERWITKLFSIETSYANTPRHLVVPVPRAECDRPS